MVARRMHFRWLAASGVSWSLAAASFGLGFFLKALAGLLHLGLRTVAPLMELRTVLGASCPPGAAGAAAAGCASCPEPSAALTADGISRGGEKRGTRGCSEG